MFSVKRKLLSEKVEALRGVKQGDDVYQHLLVNGVNQQKLDEYILNGTIKNVASEISDTRLEQDIEQLFDLGGVISGGCALSFIHHTHKTKDVDFYFNDDVAYVKAFLYTYDNPLIDVCYYFDKPHELHDMSLVMCNLYRDRDETTSQAKVALETNISDIYPENVIWPDRTAKRMLKYHKRIGVRFKQAQVLCLCGIYDIDRDISMQILDISV